jgi:formate hydrogenlyase subunit 4
MAYGFRDDADFFLGIARQKSALIERKKGPGVTPGR